MKETTEVPITLTFGIFLSKKEGKWKSLIVSSKNVNGSLNPTSYYSPQLYYFFPPKIPQTEAQGEGRWIWKKDFCFFIAIHQVQAFPGVHFESYPGLQTCTGKLQSSHTHTHSPPAQLAILAKNPRILPNFCTLLPYLKRLCLKLTALPLSQEVAFSQQLQKGTCSTS